MVVAALAATHFSRLIILITKITAYCLLLCSLLDAAVLYTVTSVYTTCSAAGDQNLSSRITLEQG